MKTSKIVLSVMVVLLIALPLLLDKHFAKAEPDWNSLNQIVEDQGDRAYFRWSPQAGVYCTGVTIIYDCGNDFQTGDYWAELQTWATLACDTAGKPGMRDLWYRTSGLQVVGTWNQDWRVDDGDQIKPKVSLLAPCEVQVLANGLADKRNQWQNWQPLAERSDPYP